MSEYMAHRPEDDKPKTIQELDNSDTLFDATDPDLDKLIDAGVATYGEARALLSCPATWDVPNGESVSVTMLERYQDELHLLEEISKGHMRASLVANPQHPRITERYGDDTERVVEGAQRNMRNGAQIINSIYHKSELVAAGFDEQELTDDIVKMRYNYRAEYSGSENRNKREARRRYLRKMIAGLSQPTISE